MKIYTKTGDGGTTSLFGGKRVNKDDIRIDAYGTVDELNAHIGVLISIIPKIPERDQLTEIQSRLFMIGSSLASDPDKDMITPDIDLSDIESLEISMDQMDTQLSRLHNFVMPSGSHAIATAHVCRTVCRRAERSHAIATAHVCRTVCRRAERLIVSLSRNSDVNPIIIIYINRLSDYFFVLSRFIAVTQDIEEVLWIPKIKK